MSRLPFIKTLAVLFVALFLFAQGMAQAHTIEFGDQHDHDGVACSVSILGEDKTLLPAPIDIDVPVPVETLILVLEPTKAIEFLSVHPSRAPPPRAPPV